MRTNTLLRKNDTPRSQRVAWSTRAGAVLVLLSLSAITPLTARSELRDYAVRWIPSSSENVERYLLSVGESTGSYSLEFDLGLPPEAGGEMAYAMQLEDSVDLYLALRARAVDGLDSALSNEIVVARAVSPNPDPDPDPGPGPDPGFGVTALTGLRGEISGAVVVTAVADGGTGSVKFQIDGVDHRIEDSVPYSLGGSGTAGIPFPYDTRVLSDGEHSITATGYGQDQAGNDVGRSVTVVFTVNNSLGSVPGGAMAPPRAGLLASDSGEIFTVDLDGGLISLVAHPLAVDGDLRPVWCDLDGDDEADLAIGFGPGSGGQILVLRMQDRMVAEQLFIDAGTVAVRTGPSSYTTYGEINGETHPACGDIDGDGLDEVVVGLGPGTGAKIQVFDDLSTGFANITPVTTDFLSLVFGGFLSSDGTAMPACGDIDGDGIDEIVIGRGAPGTGHLSIFDDAQAEYATIRSDIDFAFPVPAIPLVVPVAAGVDYDGSVRPAVGDIDGDGIDEIVVGMGQGAGGRLIVLDDGSTDFEQITVSGSTDGSLRSGWDGYNAVDGQTFPSLADIDADGLAEIGVGFGPGGEGWTQVLDDLQQGFPPHPDVLALDGMVDTQLGGLRVIPALQQ